MFSRYIYGHGIEINLTELYATYLAGDKYLVNHLVDSLIDFIRKNLNASNCCLIYEQLGRIQRDDELLDQIRNLIKLHSDTAFKSDKFTEISQETLVDILKFESLNIDEIDVLKACWNWIEKQIVKLDIQATEVSRQKLFQPIKPLIRFVDLRPEEIGAFENEIKSLLSSQEILSLFFHILDKSKPLLIGYQGPRSRNTHPYSVLSTTEVEFVSNLSKIETFLRVSQKVYLRSIHAVNSLSDIVNLELKIYKDNSLLLFDSEQIRIDNRWCFKFTRCLEICPSDTFKLSFNFNAPYVFDSNYKLNNDFDLRLENYGHLLNFILSPVDSGHPVHCIHQIDFSLSPEI